MRRGPPAGSGPERVPAARRARPAASGLRLPSEEYARFVVRRVRAIPRGRVATYGDVDPHAPRQVGQVLATSDEEMPWHRVVRADGTLPIGRTQYRRLRHEGVPFRGRRVVMSLVRYLRLRSAGPARPGRTT